MDWVWFWGATGEVAKNLVPLVVALAGIIGTYKAGSRSDRAREEQERFAYRRQVYADFLGTAGEIVGYVSHYAAMAITFSKGRGDETVVGSALSDVLPTPLPPDTSTRLSRSSAVVQMLEPSKQLRRAASDLEQALVAGLVWCSAANVGREALNEAAMDAGLKYRALMDLLRADVAGVSDE